MRRKGERPIVESWPPYTPSHPVAQMIATGDKWMHAWMAQACTPFVRLERASGVSIGRLMAIGAGGELGRSEIEALAGAWHVDVADLIASLPDPSIIREDSGNHSPP